jgi:hypothetical protein
MAVLTGCRGSHPAGGPTPSTRLRPTEPREQPLPLNLQVLPSKEAYVTGELIEIRVRLANPTEEPVTVLVFPEQLVGRDNWGLADDAPIWRQDDVPVDQQVILPDGSSIGFWPSIALPVTDDEAEFVTIDPGAVYEKTHTMQARVEGAWQYSVYFTSHRNRIYKGAYDVAPMCAALGDEHAKRWMEEWGKKGYVRADESPYALMKVDPRTTMGCAGPVGVRVEVAAPQ